MITDLHRGLASSKHKYRNSLDGNITAKKQWSQYYFLEQNIFRMNSFLTKSLKDSIVWLIYTVAFCSSIFELALCAKALKLVLCLWKLDYWTRRWILHCKYDIDVLSRGTSAKCVYIWKKGTRLLTYYNKTHQQALHKTRACLFLWTSKVKVSTKNYRWTAFFFYRWFIYIVFILECSFFSWS